MTDRAQLALLLDPLRDQLTEPEIAAVEAKVADDDERRGRYGIPAPGCRCARPWPIRGACIKCGRSVRRTT